MTDSTLTPFHIGISEYCLKLENSKCVWEIIKCIEEELFYMQEIEVSCEFKVKKESLFKRKVFRFVKFNVDYFNFCPFCSKEIFLTGKEEDVK